MSESLRPIGFEFVTFIPPSYDDDPTVGIERYGHFEVYKVVNHQPIPRFDGDKCAPLREVHKVIMSIKETRKEMVERLEFELYLSGLRKEFYRRRERAHEQFI